MPVADNIDEYIDLIINSAERAADLTQKLLSFSRKSDVTFAPLDIHSTINSTVSILEHTISKKIYLKTELKSHNYTVNGDITLLQNIFLNIGINSSHAIPDTGEICYKTSEKYINTSECRQLRLNLTPGPYLIIEISDTGCGISQENMQKIFEPFFTTKEQGKGTGLGLASAYGGVHQHNGEITVSSKLNIGTSFFIYLPLIDETTPKIENKTSPFKHGKGLILVVDDEDVMRKTGQLMLEKIGYSVITANDGEEALTKYEDNSDIISLVILDMLMPKMDGAECLAKIRTISPSQPVIFASGYSKDKNSEIPEADGFLKKPYKMIDLGQICSKLINE